MGVFFRERRWRSARTPAAVSETPNVHRKLAVLGGVTVLAFITLSCQLFRLQVLDVGHYQLLAEDNRLFTRSEPAARGLIFDRRGLPLAENVPSFSAAVVPGYLPRDRESEVYAALQSLVRVPAFEIEQRVHEARDRNDLFTPVVIKRELDHETAILLHGYERRGELPGAVALADPVRYYRGAELTSHQLGYIGSIAADELKQLRDRGYRPDDRLGKAGIELTFEGYLRGVSGWTQWEVDASGRRLRDLGSQPPRPGYNLTLTLDLELQRTVTAILQESVRDLASKKAVAIVIDVNTGELLADVSLPSYDNNIFSHPLDEAKYDALTQNPDKPLLDHAIAEKFPPGSTFKIVTGLAALQSGVATANTTIVSNGALLVPRDYDESIKDTLPDWRPGLGAMNFYRGLAMSSDIYFYCLAGGGCDQLKEGVGNERLARYARMFGFGEPTGIDLPGETDGLVGDAAWLSKSSGGAQTWFKADTYYQGIGQGYVEATPLQVARMVTAVANGGQLLRPRIVREVRDAGGSVVLPERPDVKGRVGVSEANLAIVREAMRQAVADGTAEKAKVPGLQIAGKTGTAEYGNVVAKGNTYGRYKEHGWFVGFAPFDRPEIAVVVFHEQGGGALTASPTAGRIFKAYFDMKTGRTATVSDAPAALPARAVPAGRGAGR